MRDSCYNLQINRKPKDALSLHLLHNLLDSKTLQALHDTGELHLDVLIMSYGSKCRVSCLKEGVKRRVSCLKELSAEVGFLRRQEQ